jgi:protein-S-isoprenylcysteine O-methyltransferase Ste14
MTPTAPETSGVRFPPPLIYVGVLAAGFLLQWRWPVRIWPDRPLSAHLAGAVLILLGAATAASGVLTFRSVGTSPNPTRPSTALALTGPYRFTRNPMYLGLAIGSAGVAVACNAVWPLALLPVSIVLVTRFVIAREERYLETRFGSAYASYKESVRRWLCAGTERRSSSAKTPRRGPGSSSRSTPLASGRLPAGRG